MSIASLALMNVSPLEPFSLYYASVNDTVQVNQTGRIWIVQLLAKANITDAFKFMPIHISDWPLFGDKWESKLYFAVKLT